MGVLVLDGSEPPPLQTPAVQPLPAPPPAAPRGFAALVARTDRNARAILGGEEMLYRPATGVPVPVTGIFDERYVLVDSGMDGAGVETVAPAVFLQLADLPSDPREDSPILTIQGRDYQVVERKPAGMGSILLVLRLVT